METCDQKCVDSFLLSRRLPYPALKLILEYLDNFDLRTLRLVSKTTKSWVETPELLRQFPVRITGKARLDNLLLTAEPVPWNSFIFSRDYASICEAGVQRFLAAYGDHVRELTFSRILGNNDWPQLQLHLLSSCPHLESLRSGELNFDFISNELANHLLQNWENLIHFEVDNFCGSHKTEPGPMPFFSRLLSTCTHLKTLRIPVFKKENAPLSDYGYMFSLHSGDSYECHVATPLLDIIANGCLQSVSQTYCDDETLLRLAVVCRENSTVLRGVASPFLENLPPEHLSVLDIIGDLHTITDAIIRQSLTNVREIYFTVKSFRAFEDGAYTMPPFPYLTSVVFDLRFLSRDLAEHRKYMEAMKLFAHRLVKVKRPSVKRLRVAYEPNTPVTFPIQVGLVDWCTSFVNLRVLTVISWEGKYKDWLKLWPLVGNTLVELDLLHCLTLNDRGILGDDLSQPAFLQLKHLRKLTLENWISENKTITELSFLHVFRHMRLQEFLFYTKYRAPRRYLQISMHPRDFSSGTVRAMWQGVFGETIERYELQGRDMMSIRPLPQEKPSGDQEVSLENDGPPKLGCCSIS